MPRTTEHVPATADRPALELVRSTRRRRSATAFVRDGQVVVQLPAGLPSDEEQRMVARLVDRVTGRERARARGGDDQLLARAVRLADRHLDGVRPASVAWSGRMRRRWGSCTPATGAIRISDELAAMPDRALDYVLVHELAHLQVHDHSPAFHRLVDRYPHTRWAQGFLAGVRHAQGRGDLGVDDDLPQASSSPGSSSSPVSVSPSPASSSPE